VPVMKMMGTGLLILAGSSALQVQPLRPGNDVQDEATGYVRTFTAEKVLRRGERLDAQSTDSTSSLVEFRIDGSASTT